MLSCPILQTRIMNTGHKSVILSSQKFQTLLMCLLEYVVREGGNKKRQLQSKTMCLNEKLPYCAITSISSVSNNCIILFRRQQIQWITPSWKGDSTFQLMKQSFYSLIYLWILCLVLNYTKIRLWQYTFSKLSEIISGKKDWHLFTFLYFSLLWLMG